MCRRGIVHHPPECHFLFKKRFVILICRRLNAVVIDDMYDTMYEAMGVGLAAPQVGILKRIVVIDTDGTPYTMINPRILETAGEQEGSEGCLSVPGKAGMVRRPNYVKAEAYNENMERYEVEAEGLLARAICHELDHLDGKLYVDLVEGDLYDVETGDDDEE